MSTAAGVTCPRCGCEYVFRSHRRGIEMPLLRLFQLIPYRCDSCDHRFYIRCRQKPNSASRDETSSIRPAA